MKIFITLLSLVALCNANVAYRYVQTPIITKSHSQDELGQYHFGYNDGQSARQELKTVDGVTRGSFSYIDANGEIQTVSYTADALNGFVASGAIIPKAPVDESSIAVTVTPEVAAATDLHNMAIEKALKIAPVNKATESSETPTTILKQVEYTPEVAAARAEHFALKNQAILRENYAQRNVVYASPQLIRSQPQYTGLRVIPSLYSYPRFVY